MKTFFDSSAFAKRYVDEPGSDAVEAACLAATDLGLCVICVPEIVSAFNRRLRERMLRPADYKLMKERLVEDVSDATIVDLTPAVIKEAVVMLETSVLRAADALHVAAAVVWGAEWFVSADRRQLAAARRAGLRTKAV
ncbi:MAG: type II toxin-antitoxin system VapC family toxin [Planctomycetia bacterium]